MTFVLTLISLMVLFDLVWWWFAHRWLGRMRNAKAWRIFAACFFVIQAGGLLAFLVSRLYFPQWRDLFPVVYISAIYIWHLLILPIVIVLLVIVSVGEGIAGIRNYFKNKKRFVPDQPTEGISRRQFVAGIVGIMPPLLLGGAVAYGLPQLRDFRIRRFEVEIPGMPQALDGLTIAHVSDVHVGRFTRGEILEDVVKATNDLDADLILLTGDLINDALSYLDGALEMVKKMKARHGVFMCEGNHDLIEGKREFEQRTKESGIDLLVNESRHVFIKGIPIQILGLRWGGLGEKRSRGDVGIEESMAFLMQQRDMSAFPILLAHHPHAFDAASRAGIPLTLSGHTHGGQLMVNEKLGGGPAIFRYWSGIYGKEGSLLSVSNGVGNWFPMRVNAPAEIIHLTLKFSGTVKA